MVVVVVVSHRRASRRRRRSALRSAPLLSEPLSGQGLLSCASPTLLSTLSGLCLSPALVRSPVESSPLTRTRRPANFIFSRRQRSSTRDLAASEWRRGRRQSRRAGGDFRPDATVGLDVTRLRSGLAHGRGHTWSSWRNGRTESRMYNELSRLKWTSGIMYR